MSDEHDEPVHDAPRPVELNLLCTSVVLHGGRQTATFTTIKPSAGQPDEVQITDKADDVGTFEQGATYAATFSNVQA
jgi:hypothetical protein